MRFIVEPSGKLRRARSHLDTVGQSQYVQNHTSELVLKSDVLQVLLKSDPSLRQCRCRLGPLLYMFWVTPCQILVFQLTATV